MNEQQSEELYMILGKLIQMYTKGETSQVSVEIADRIFQSVEYCISIDRNHRIKEQSKQYEQELDEKKSESKQDKQVQEQEKSEYDDEGSMLTAYQNGYQLGEECVQQTKKLWIKVKNSAVNVDNNSYRETIWNGISQFFDRYSLRYAANEIPKELSYPLANPVTGLSGILYVNQYLTSLLIENQFMAKFDINEIRSLLAGMDAQDPDLSLSLFEAILTNAIAHVLLNNPCTTLDLTRNEQNDVKELIKELTIADLQERMEQAGHKLLTELGLTTCQADLQTGSLERYVQAVLKRLSYQWSKEVKTGAQVKRFVSLDQEASALVLSLSGNRLTLDEWMECNFSLNQAYTLKEKLSILAERIHHMDDLIRCFDHFAGEEYYTVFAMVNQQEKEELLAAVTEHRGRLSEEGLLESWEQALLEYDQKTKN